MHTDKRFHMKFCRVSGCLKWSLLLWALLHSCCGVTVYDPSNYHTKFESNSGDCALMLKRSFSHSSRISNPFIDDSHLYGPSEAVMGDCIRYEDVNNAFSEAKRNLGYVPGYSDPRRSVAEQVDDVAAVIIETTRILAKRFHLSREEVYYALPTIDTSKTDIWNICPDEFKPKPCTMWRFRTYDGQCTNIRNGVTGMVGTPFTRFLVPQYRDDVTAPKVSVIDNIPLPHPRMVSIKVHTDISQLTESRSSLLMSWGQVFDHDLLLSSFAQVESGRVVICCVDPTNRHPTCRPIAISQKDPFYARYNFTCMEFLRAFSGLKPGCALGPRTTGNFVSPIIDVNFLYGNSEAEARRLRLGEKGLMKTWPKHRDLGLKDLLPPMTDTPDLICFARPRNKYCFLSGDERTNFQPPVLVVHIYYVREHNRIATELGHLNPHWDDERIFQETRHIMAALFQHITFNEFLPLLLGPTYIQMYNLTLQREGYWYGYDKNVPVGTDLALQAAAFRFGHTILHQKFRLYDKYHTFVDSFEAHATFGQPFDLYRPGILDQVIGGSVNTPIQQFDRFMTSEVTKRLFQTPELPVGLDLATLNINRGREIGLPGYNYFREWCGLPRAKTFEELDYYLGNKTARLYSQLFKHPDEIDLFSAGIAERPVEGGTVGPTFACIIARNMDVLRRGDRFWYENPGFPSSFTPAQLGEIRKITQAKIMCENADDFPTIQMWTFLLPDPEKNPRYFCKDLPQINLEFWMEDPKTEEFIYAL